MLTPRIRYAYAVPLYVLSLSIQDHQKASSDLYQRQAALGVELPPQMRRRFGQDDLESRPDVVFHQMTGHGRTVASAYHHVGVNL
jgi:hypothetical protein